MAPPSQLPNGAGATAGKSITSRMASVYSEVQNSRLDHPLALPSVFRNPFKIVDGPASSAAGNPDEIAKLFPSLFEQPSAMLVPGESNESGSALKIGVVLSGGQAPGGHNVISGIFDYLQEHCKGSTIYGFKGGPAGIMKGKYVILTPDYIYPYRNQGGFDMICSGRDKIETPEQFKQAEDIAVKLDLDGLVVIGGDDSNTNACLLAEYFRSKDLKTRVIGCPKTIDGDLKCKEVPTSFGFDTACKIYAEQIGNVMIDARSTGKYYHFVRLMGRAASHITLECALQTHPNITLIGEEVASKKLTLKNVTDYIADVICKRASLGYNYGVILIPEGLIGYNYGVILIPEGLIDFIPEVDTIRDDDFWNEVENILKITKPIYLLVKFCDGEGPKMGEIYEKMDNMLGQIKDVMVDNIYGAYFHDVEQIILKRWEKMTIPLHCLGFALTPRFYDTRYLESLAPGGTRRKAPNLDKEVVQGVMDAFGRIAENRDEQRLLREQFATFHMKKGLYSLPSAQMDAVTMEAIDWWSSYGAETPELAEVAKKVLSQPISSSSAERNWSTYSYIHSVKRNRLNSKRADKLVFVHSNIRLSSRFSEAYKEGPHKKWDMDPECTNLEGSSSMLQEMEWEDLDYDENNGKGKRQRVELD